ncbi:MAG: nitrilase-related carbon-nitrogen hydrolase [Acidimicrobiales bacterium]
MIRPVAWRGVGRPRRRESGRGRHCARPPAYIQIGLAEVDLGTGLLHNSVALVGPGGVLGSYRKAHPFIWDPRWAADGEEPSPVWNTSLGRLSPMICHDLDYPEVARAAALAGAEVLLVSSCWCEEAAPSPIWQARAAENGVYVVVGDGVACERGVQFSGGSCVIGPDGALAEVWDTGPGIALAEVDPARGGRPCPPVPSLDERRPAAFEALDRRTYAWEPGRFFSLGAEPAALAGPADPDGASGPDGLFAPRAPDRHLSVWAVQARVPDRASDQESADRLRQSLAHSLAQEIDPGRAAGEPGLVVLAEGALTGGPVLDTVAARALGEGRGEGPAAAFLSAQARLLGVDLVGALVEKVGDRCYLAVVLAGPDGGYHRSTQLSADQAAWATRGRCWRSWLGPGAGSAC